MAKRQAARNVAKCKPQPLVGHKVNDEGRVILLVPRFRSRWLGWFQNRLKKPFFKVNLDDVGSFTWLKIDGNHTVEEIGGALEEKFGEKIQPTGERLSLFLGMLKRNKFAAWDEVDSEPAPDENYTKQSEESSKPINPE